MYDIINSLTYSIKTIIYHPNSTKLVITTPSALSRWSHTDLFLQIQIKNFLLEKKNSRFYNSDQKFVTR